MEWSQSFLSADEVVHIYDARTGDWSAAAGAELEVGDTWLDDGQLQRWTDDWGRGPRRVATVEELADADATWTAEAATRVPGTDEWVLVLGEADEAGHWKLGAVEAGERFAFQGPRVRDRGRAMAMGSSRCGRPNLVLAEVVQTFKRMVVDEVIDLQLEYADGETATITGTHEHPFYVPAVDQYVKLGELEPGTVLRTDARGEAAVVGLARHEGEFEVFNIEVGEAHNYFVRGPGFDGPGVLVYNKPMKLPVSFTGGQVGKKFGQHGKEFGLEMSADGARAYKEMAQEVVALPGEVRKGAWNPKGGGGDNYNFYAQDDTLVITDADDNFVTMFKQDDGGNQWFNNATPVE